MNWHQDAVDIGIQSSVIKVDFDAKLSIA